jgi:hypothetical protein
MIEATKLCFEVGFLYAGNLQTGEPLISSTTEQVTKTDGLLYRKI